MASLREKVEAEFQNLDEALRDLPRPDKLGDLSPLELAGTAALLSSLYNGIENILKQVLLARKTTLPTGAAWHRDLLNLAAERAVISPAILNQLASYLAFRHFFSHAYGFDLDPERLEPLVSDLARVYDGFRREVFAALPRRPRHRRVKKKSS
jgi:hypothetical protein